MTATSTVAPSKLVPVEAAGPRTEAGDQPGAAGLQVEMVEPLGSETLVWYRIGKRPVSILPGRETTIRLGDTLPASLPLYRLTLFDAETGIRF